MNSTYMSDFPNQIVLLQIFIKQPKQDKTKKKSENLKLLNLGTKHSYLKLYHIYSCFLFARLNANFIYVGAFHLSE